MALKEIVKKTLSYCGINIGQLAALVQSYKNKAVICNVNHTECEKNCLMLYVTAPFQTKHISQAHQNQWQAVEMARIIGTYGYNVDVADYSNADLKFDKQYDMVIGLIPRGIDVYSSYCKPDCIKVAYLTSMNLAVTSGNEEKRLAELEERRGVKLQPRVFAGYIQPEIENFTAAWYFGNDYNFHSYDCFKMPPSFRVINSGYSFDWFNPELERNPKNFLFIASRGQVHKGLDLLLEIFAEEVPDCHLYICSSFKNEEDFCNEYDKELFHTPNIHAIGFVDISSAEFRKIAESCAYTILPSCAEGHVGSILTAMSAGLIPIVSRECAYEDDEAINLPDCSKTTLSSYIKEYSQKDKQWLRKESIKAVDTVKTKFSQACFSESIVRAMEGTLRAKEV